MSVFVRINTNWKTFVYTNYYRPHNWQYCYPFLFQELHSSIGRSLMVSIFPLLDIDDIFDILHLPSQRASLSFLID